MAKNILVLNPYYGGLYGEAKPEKYLFMLQVYETKGRDFTSWSIGLFHTFLSEVKVTEIYIP